jgi:predicted amidohydrolase
MILALASPRIATSLEDGLGRVRRLMGEAAARDAEIVCFPEAYLPGLRGVDIDVLPWDPALAERTLRTVSQWARELGIATILGTERLTPAGRQVAAVVFDASGATLGWQAKTQLAPSEDPFYVPGTGRRLFEVGGTKFGIAICHEGWRYPETVRWAAVRGAKVVFHPQHTGSDVEGARPDRFGAESSPYYEKAMVMRSIENAIYFASVNYALRSPESATCVIDPAGACQAHLPYGEEGVLVAAIDASRATGFLAARFAPERYAESTAE